MKISMMVFALDTSSFGSLKMRSGKMSYTGRNVKLVLLFITVTWAYGLEGDKRSLCRVHSDTGQLHWRLECEFHEDIKESRNTFQVYHIRQEGSPDLVAEGRWTEGDYTVYTADGYEHDGLATNKVFIRIQKRAVHGGRMYACILPPVGLQDVRTCHLSREYLSNLNMALHNSSSSNEGSSLSSSVLETPTVSMSSAKLPVAQDMVPMVIIAAIDYSIVIMYP